MENAKLTKNLANCTPTEFVAQTMKIKRAVKNWMDLTHIVEIRSKKPRFESYSGSDFEEKKAVVERNQEALRKQAMENFSEILDEALEKHPRETLNIIALCCFVEPDHVDDYAISDYLISISELFQNEAVMSFFYLLVQLGSKNGKKA